jgi:DNA-binding response OmpR family regulator
MTENRRLLIVEDSDEDFEVTCWALRKAGLALPVIRCVRAEEALPYLCPQPPRPNPYGNMPCLVLLDLNLPGMTGLELLEVLQRGEPPSAVPVLILSTSKNPRDIVASYRFGASGYICKPLSLDRFVEKMRVLISYWFDAVTLPDENE